MWVKSHELIWTNVRGVLYNGVITNRKEIMETEIKITYTTDNPDINDAIQAILDNTLPYMVDNVDISFYVEE
jgi:hypothetical protein